VRFKKRRLRKRGALLGPSGAGKALHSVLNRYGAAREIREHRILIHWGKIVGPRVAAHTTPDALSKGTLWVRVDSSSWMHQLSFLKVDILEKANELCGEELVSDIRFHLGRRKERSDDAISAAARIRRPPARERPLPPPAVGQALEAIKDEAGGIEDAELRDAIVDIRRRLNL
jgi:hypothetical protein